MDSAVPQQLARLLEKIKDFQGVHTPRLNIQRVEERAIREGNCAAIPSDIHLFPFSRYVRENFRNPNQWGVQTDTLRQSIISAVADKDVKLAVMLNQMLLRYAVDKTLKGVELKLFADYIAITILSNYQIRDEALAQIASLTWSNYDDDHKSRLWLLLTHCLSCIMPSPQLYSFLLKYVSDHGMNAYPAMLQQKMLRMPQNNSSSESRLFPPCILEWQSNFACSSMAIKIHLPDDSVAFVEVNSWTTAEEAASRALESKLGHRVKGWSLILDNENGQIIEVSGHDYLLDLFSYMELFPELDTPPHEFLIYRSGAQRNPPFDESEFLQTERKSMRCNHSQAERIQKPQSSTRQQSPQDGPSFLSNFSYGPPNIRMLSDPYTEYKRNHSVHNMHADPSTGMIGIDALSNRIKGGGKMMQPMAMGGGMMMQPQMMQNPMMQNPMMQSPMMQQPQMMMHPQMMPMQNMPMMQPVMQPQMTMPMQQQMPMAMPTSMGMMSAMDPASQQQATMQQQMQTLLKQQEEQDKKVKKLLKQALEAKEDSGYRTRKSHRKKSTRDENKYRRDSSSENRSPSYRHQKRYSSDDEEPRRRHDLGRRPKAATVVTASYLKKQTPSEKPRYGNYKEPKVQSPGADAKGFSRSYLKPRPRKEEDFSEVSSKSQGTVRMSFNEKRKFFMQKSMSESQSHNRKAPPKKIELPLSEEQHMPEQYCYVEDGENESWKKPTEPNDEDTHEEALRWGVNAAKKNQDEKKQRIEELAFLSRQRREAARKQSAVKEPVYQNRSPSPEPLRRPKSFRVVTPKREASSETVAEPKPHSTVTKLKPQRMIPMKEPIRSPPNPRTPPTSLDSTPPASPRDSPPPVITAAAWAKVFSERQEMEDEEEMQEEPRQSSPSPPPIDDPEPTPKTPPVMRRDDDTRTTFHVLTNNAPSTYANVKWKVRVRKEVFHAGEYIKDLKMKNLVFRQIAYESKNGSPRITPSDRNNINLRLVNSAANIETSTLESALQMGQQEWAIYFTQMFRIKVREVAPDLPRALYQANAIGIGQTGVHFIMMNETADWKTHTYDFDVVSQVKGLQNTVLDFSIEGKNVSLHCRKSSQLQKLILPYLSSLPPKPLASPPTTPRQENESLLQHDTMSLDQQEPQESVYEVLPPPKGTQFSLLIYAKKCFKKPKEVEKALQHSKVALSKTLHDIKEPEEAAAALQCFKLIQQFMGDAQMRSITELDTVYRILHTCGKHRSDDLLDEVCIYFTKQLTMDKKLQSCLLGWRLFSLFLAYYKCSRSLMPHLLAHLHEISHGTDETNARGATVCLINFQQTETFGGRQQMPSDVELKSLIIGRTTFDQLFFIPGWADAKFKITTSTVIMQAIAHFCTQLGITDENDMAEFSVFTILMGQDDKVSNILPQKRNVYLLDILNYMKQKEIRFILAFQRIVWKKQINYNNEKLILMLFNQVVAEYIDGKYLTYQELADGLTKLQFTESANLVALLHRGFEGSNSPTFEKVKSFIPRKALVQQPESIWKKQVHEQFTAVQKMSPHEARCEVLALLAKRKFFGATFFTAKMTGASGHDQMKMISIGTENLCIFDLGNHLIEAEHGLSAITDVEVRTDKATNSPVCAISINVGSGVSEISLRTPKAAVILAVLNHHIQVALT